MDAPLPRPRGRASVSEVPPGVLALNSGAREVGLPDVIDDGELCEASSSVSALRFKLRETLTDAAATGRLDGLLENALAPEEDEIVRCLFPDAAPVWDEAFTLVDEELCLVPDASSLGGDRSVAELKSCLNLILSDAVADGSLAGVMEGALGNHDAIEEVTLEKPSVQAETLDMLMFNRMLQARDQRIGELQFLITEAERLVAERDTQRGHLEDALSLVRQDIAHLDLDLQSQKQALQTVNDQFDELLELASRSKVSKKISSNSVCADASRSEVSTSASGGTVNSYCTVGTSLNRTYTLS